MNKITLFLTLFASVFVASMVSAQDIPAEIKTKIEETAKANAKISEAKRESWVNRQIEAWDSISIMTFTIPKADVEKIKELAQKKYPYHYSKQEPFIQEQADSLAEILELKTNFAKGEFEPVFEQLKKKNNDNYKAILEELNTIVELKAELDQFTIDGMDANMLSIIKKGVAAQYPTDYNAQLKALKQQAKMMELANEAKETRAEKENQPQEVRIFRTEQIKKAEEVFKKIALTVNGNEKTGTGVVMNIKNTPVLMFPADLYSPKGLVVVNASGEEASVSLKKVYAAKNAPFMLVPLPELPIEITPATFASDSEIKECISQNVILIGHYGEMIRPVMMKITKTMRNKINTASPILNQYYEGSMLLHPKNYSVLGFCVKPPKELPEIDFTSNRLKSDFERASNKESRHLIALRSDTKINWEPVKPEKMREQIKATKDIEDLNLALTAVISGDFEEGKRHKMISAIAEKYTKILDTPMDISKLKIEYRSYMNALNTLIKRNISKLKLADVYPNLKNRLGYHLEFTQRIQEEIKREMSKNSITLAPKEFKKEFEREGY